MMKQKGTIMIDANLQASMDTLKALRDQRDAVNAKITQLMREQQIAKAKAKAEKQAQREAKRLATLKAAEVRAAKAAEKLAKLKMKVTAIA